MKNSIKTIPMIIAGFLLAMLLIYPVNARGGVFVIEQMKEAVEVLPSLKVVDSAAGNLSADGFIDFYALSPNGTMLLCYNRTDFAEFRFSPDIEGISTLHIANRYESRNVTVTLQYGINVVIILTASISTSFQMPTPKVTITPLEPSVWSELLDYLRSLLPYIPFLGAIGKALKSFVNWIKEFRKRRWWKKKYGKPRTPSTVKGSSGMPSLGL